MHVDRIPELTNLDTMSDDFLHVVFAAVSLAVASYIGNGQDEELLDGARKYRTLKAEIMKRAEATKGAEASEGPAFVVPGPTAVQ